MMPGGRYAAADLDKAGGTPLVAKRMVERAGHDDAMTVTGDTFAAAAAKAEETPGQDVVGRSRTRSRTPAGWSSSRATSRRTAR